MQSRPLKPLALTVYPLLLVAMVVVGCTSKEDPSEVLSLCGNHSCGELFMVTTDTSSDGYQYLEPDLAPSSDWITFTADWGAIPSSPEPPDPQPENRQILVIPAQPSLQPVSSITVLGANLVRLMVQVVEFAGQQQAWPALDQQKGAPIWQDASTIIFWMFLPRGSRLCRADVSAFLTDNVPVNLMVPWDVLYYEPEDGSISGGFFQHLTPALSPDGEWLAYTRTRCDDPHEPSSCDQLSLWVLQMSTAGGAGAVTFPVTTEAALLVDPSWSSDGSRLVFGATPDYVGDDAGFGEEIFTIAFDTTGLAATGEVTKDNELFRVTHTTPSPGDPLEDTVRNYGPVYAADQNEILFISTRRAPSVTLHDRNIWRVPSDGSLEPAIYFFSRYDDVDPYLDADTGRILLSSRMGFPTEMLDRLEEEARIRIAEEDSTLADVEVQALAAAERIELEFFDGVMSQLYVFRP